MIANGDLGEGHLCDVVFLNTDVFLELEKFGHSIAHIKDENTQSDYHEKYPEYSGKNILGTICDVYRMNG